MAAAQPSSNPRIPLPKLVTDPTWSLRPWPVDLTIHGLQVQVPALPAADWLDVLWGPGDLSDILPGLLGEDQQDAVEEMLFTEQLPLEELEDLQLQLLDTVTGRPWYVSLRLVAIVKASWDSMGAEVLKEADATRLSIAGWIDTVYLLILRNLEQNKVQMFLSKLELPPVGFATEDPQDLEMTPEQFLALGQ